MISLKTSERLKIMGFPFTLFPTNLKGILPVWSPEIGVVWP
jgi:hypothetical protein